MTDHTTTDAAELDRTRRYLRPVARLQLPGQPDVVHLSVYEWLPQFEAWATGMALCGYSTRQGPLPKGTKVTCAKCLKWQPQYERKLSLEDAAQGEQTGPGRREVRIVVHAPTDENAAQWAQTIRDLVVAEYGQDMRLEVTITTGGQA